MFNTATTQYFRLLEQLDQAAIATDSEGHIMYWGTAAATMYGWRSAEVLGRDVVEVTPSDMTRSQAAEIMAALRGGEVWSGEFEVRSRDGRTFLASVTDVPILNGSQQVTGVVGVSAESRRPADLREIVRRFAAACNAIWPERVALQESGTGAAPISASEPHAIQLLSLLLIRYAEALEEDALCEIVLSPADKSIFADFAVTAIDNAMYVRIGRRDAKEHYSVLRDVKRMPERTPFSSALVRMFGGVLMTGGTSTSPADSMHLFVPLRESE